MDKYILKHRFHWSQRSFILSVISAFLLLVISLMVNYFANIYATRVDQQQVSDIVLSNIRVFDVDVIVNYGPIAVLSILFIIFLLRPSSIPFVLKSGSLLILVRAVFMTLTHIGQFQPQLPLSTEGVIYFISGGNDGGLFFSGHTALPFLFALTFWSIPSLGYLFLFTSIVLGLSTLLGHLHYSIDVLGAFFITYTVFVIAQKFFAKDFSLLIKNH